MSNGIYTSALNAAIEIERLIETTHAECGGSIIAVARQVAFEAGWAFGGITTEAINREFNDLVAACCFINAVRTNRGLFAYPIVSGLESGREAAAVEHQMLNQN